MGEIHLVEGIEVEQYHQVLEPGASVDHYLCEGRTLLIEEVGA